MSPSAFIDTNIFVYSLIASSSFHAKSREILDWLLEEKWELWISEQTIREALCVMTKGNFLEPPLDPAEVAKDIRRASKAFRIAPVDAMSRVFLLSLMADPTIRGRRVFDASIVATMLSNSIEKLVTSNPADFADLLQPQNILPLAEWPY